VKLQALRRKFKFLMMEESDTIGEYFDKIQELMNAMKSCGDKISEQHVLNKVLWSLLPKFDHMVILIEETKDLEKLEIEELHHSLKAHEYRMDEQKHYQEQVLQTRSQYKVKGRGSKSSSKNNVRHKDSPKEKKEGSNGAYKHKQHKSLSLDGEKEWKFDKRKVRCHNCRKLGHFARECWKGERSKNKPKSQNTQACLAKDDSLDFEAVILMARTCKNYIKDSSWYLDFGCSTHMMGTNTTRKNDITDSQNSSVMVKIRS